jgi:mono/diheme cytochrome c family protein
LCHGENGDGQSDLAEFFDPPPANLTGGDVQELSDSDLFLVITEGHGNMPSLAENLSPEQRWDVINFLHTLQTKE